MGQEDDSAPTFRWQLRPSYNTWYGQGYVRIDFVHVRLHTLMQSRSGLASDRQRRGDPGPHSREGAPAVWLLRIEVSPPLLEQRGGVKNGRAEPEKRWMADNPVDCLDRGRG